jgi:hypothetical protein
VKNTHFFKPSNVADKKEAKKPAFLHTYVHPCIINHQPHIVYPRGLLENSPRLFIKLTQFYQQQGYLIKEDQRSDKASVQAKNERRKWLPVLLFTVSLIFESSAFADVELEVNEVAAIQQYQNIELQLISNHKVRERIQLNVQQPRLMSNTKKQINSAQAESIFKVLLNRYQKQTTDIRF